MNALRPRRGIAATEFEVCTGCTATRGCPTPDEPRESRRCPGRRLGRPGGFSFLEIVLAKGIRVNQLAKELGVPSKAILDRCKAEGLGEKVPNHMTVLSIGL